MMKLTARFPLRAIALVLIASATTRVSAQLNATSQSAPAETMPDMPRLFDPRDNVRLRDRVTFFPTPTPVFGAPIGDRITKLVTVTRRRNGREITFPAPEDLADYVNESFYPALGTRLYEKKLRKPLAERLAAYRARRDALVNELWNELVIVQPSDAATRERQLREFAQGQTPRIAALENEAEGLRQALVAVDGLFGSGADWNANREWKLGAVPAGAILSGPRLSPKLPSIDESTEYLVIRAAAYFQNGLGIEQRGLLREIALTQWENMQARQFPYQSGARDPLAVFLSPETARLSLPPDLPPEVRAKIGAYSGDKDALKWELRDAIVDLDKSSDTKRTKALHELSDRQWPRLVALENLAEEIRRGLAALPPPPLPALPPALPAGLKERIEAYVRDRTALAQERLQSVRAAIERIRQSNPRRSEVVVDDGSFRLENAARYEALAQDLKSISRDLTAFARTQIDPDTGQPMDPRTLLRRLDASDRAFDKIGLEGAVYHDYRTAMLEPGLSPEQRRLLFGRAVVELAQPLAAGSEMPNGTFSGPVGVLY